VEDRLKFFESGDIPKKNIEVMKEAIEEAKTLLESSSKKKKKKKRKKDADNEEANESMKSLNGDIEEVETNGDIEEPPNKKQKKKKRKSKSTDE